jgi:ABC-type sulfate transport system substrate-binding protein
MLSPETQKLLASLHFLPTNTQVPSPYPELKVDIVDPVATLANFTKWSKLFEDTVTKPIK